MQPVLEVDPVEGDCEPSLDQDILQKLFESIQPPSPVMRRTSCIAGFPHDLPGTRQTRPPTTTDPPDSQDLPNVFEQCVVEVQSQLAEEV